jgi:transcriptional regulator with XRE-family HTH domain
MVRITSDARAADDLDRALGNAIRLRRRSLNLTQEQLASACGVSFQQIQKYENGANRISFSRLVQIARALDCRVTDLTNTLDQPEIAPADFEFLKLMTLPGAVDLLKRYEVMSPESRRLLVDLLQSIVLAPAWGDIEPGRRRSQQRQASSTAEIKANS